MLSIAAAYLSYRAWQGYRANAYRRAALFELATETDAAGIAEILKRTALATYPRSLAAKLTGATWSQWLEETGGRPVPEVVQDALSRGVYANGATEPEVEVRKFVAGWISGHRAYQPPQSARPVDRKLQQSGSQSAPSANEAKAPC